MRPGHDLHERPPHRRAVRQVQADGADIGLVRDAARRELGRDRKADDLCERCRFLDVVRHGGRGNREAKRFENFPRFVCGQPCGAARRDCGPARGPSRVDAYIVEAPQEPWRLPAPVRVLGNLGERARRVFRK